MTGKHYHKMDYGTEYTFWIPGRCESWRSGFPVGAGMTIKTALSRRDQGLLKYDDKGKMRNQTSNNLEHAHGVFYIRKSTAYRISDPQPRTYKRKGGKAHFQKSRHGQAGVVPGTLEQALARGKTILDSCLRGNDNKGKTRMNRMNAGKGRFMKQNHIDPEKIGPSTEHALKIKNKRSISMNFLHYPIYPYVIIFPCIELTTINYIIGGDTI